MADKRYMRCNMFSFSTYSSPESEVRLCRLSKTTEVKMFVLGVKLNVRRNELRSGLVLSEAFHVESVPEES